MKIGCHCGATIFDLADGLPNQAHFVSDQAWLVLQEAIDDAIEKSGPGVKEKESACMSIRRLIGKVSRRAWQCSACGQIYIEDQQHQLRSYVPRTIETSKEMVLPGI